MNCAQLSQTKFPNKNQKRDKNLLRGFEQGIAPIKSCESASGTQVEIFGEIFGEFFCGYFDKFLRALSGNSPQKRMV
jgi:hypothetical protein